MRMKSIPIDGYDMTSFCLSFNGTDLIDQNKITELRGFYKMDMSQLDALFILMRTLNACYANIISIIEHSLGYGVQLLPGLPSELTNIFANKDFIRSSTSACMTNIDHTKTDMYIFQKVLYACIINNLKCYYDCGYSNAHYSPSCSQCELYNNLFNNYAGANKVHFDEYVKNIYETYYNTIVDKKIHANKIFSICVDRNLSSYDKNQLLRFISDNTATNTSNTDYTDIDNVLNIFYDYMDGRRDMHNFQTDSASYNVNAESDANLNGNIDSDTNSDINSDITDDNEYNPYYEYNPCDKYSPYSSYNSVSDNNSYGNMQLIISSLGSIGFELVKTSWGTIQSYGLSGYFACIGLVTESTEIANVVHNVLVSERNAIGYIDIYDDMTLADRFLLVCIANDLDICYDKFIAHIEQHGKLPLEYPVEIILRIISRYYDIAITIFDSNLNLLEITNGFNPDSPIIYMYQHSMDLYYNIRPITQSDIINKSLINVDNDDNVLCIDDTSCVNDKSNVTEI